jgi:phosphatidate cytidylyltransferase
MNLFARDPYLWQLLRLVGAVLIVATVIGQILHRTIRMENGRATVSNMNQRIAVWWALIAIFSAALLIGEAGVVALFAIFSFLALREFITITPTSAADHRAIFWTFFIFTPLQYYLIATKWYGLFSILIPVYAFLAIPIRSALAGDTNGFLERTAKVQWALMICTYCLSYAPALMTLEISGYAPQHNASLLFYFLIVVQFSDVLQYVCGKIFGRTPIAPRVSPNKTV